MSKEKASSPESRHCTTVLERRKCYLITYILREREREREIEREIERERKNDDIIGDRGTWPSLHYVRLGIVNPVGTGGRPPARMGWFENREREGERER